MEPPDNQVFPTVMYHALEPKGRLIHSAEEFEELSDDWVDTPEKLTEVDEQADKRTKRASR